MILSLFWACTTRPYAIPQSDIYREEDIWKGSLSFRSQECVTVYALEGEEQICEACMEFRFTLSPIEDDCLFDDLEVLFFRVLEDQEWQTKEQDGWETWGSAVTSDEGWELRSTYYFYENE